MITAVVQIKLADGTSLEDLTAVFQSTAPQYRDINGLMRKYYLFDPETCTGGGCYLFETRAAAEAVFNEDWRAMIKDRYGAEPGVRYFETPVVVDNVSDEILGATEVADQ